MTYYLCRMCFSGSNHPSRGNIFQIVYSCYCRISGLPYSQHGRHVCPRLGVRRSLPLPPRKGSQVCSISCHRNSAPSTSDLPAAPAARRGLKINMNTIYVYIHIYINIYIHICIYTVSLQQGFSGRMVLLVFF